MNTSRTTAAVLATVVAGSALVGTAPAQAATPAPACTSTQLRLGIASHGAYLGHQGLLLTFRNASTRSCTITGYPGVAGLDAHGRQVVVASRTTKGFLAHSTVRVIVLKPGAQASTIVEYVTNQQGRTPVKHISSLGVYAPNTTHAVRLAVPARTGVVGGHFQVHPVVAGTRGSQS